MARITKITGIVILTALVCIQARAQKEKGDSIRARQLDEVVIQSQRFRTEHVSRIQDAHTWYGKKSEVVNLDGRSVNVTLGLKYERSLELRVLESLFWIG